MMWSVFWLALVFGVHIAMVNLGIFLALIVPYLKYRADKSGDEGLEKVSYKLMRFYAATYGVAGVYATAFTVFLLSFYPDFLGLAGHLTLIPFGIAIIMITVHFFSIASFYYGWNRFSRPAHYTIGFLLALSSLLIPLGFRAVFAFLNVPVGLHYANGKFYLDVTEALGNPTLLPLYLKSLTAAITAGSIAVLGGLAWAYRRTDDAAYKSGIEKVTPYLAKVAVAGLVIMFFMGLWYSLSLRVVPYKFNNVFASLGWKVGNGVAEYNVAWVFVLKMILYAFQAYVIMTLYSMLKQGKIPVDKASTLLLAGFAALATIVLGEYLNAFSQYPYFIACLGDPNGCPQLQGVPPEVLQQVAPALLLTNVNKLALVGSVKAITAAFMAFLIAATVYFFYAVFVKEKK